MERGREGFIYLSGEGRREGRRMGKVHSESIKTPKKIVIERSGHRDTNQIKSPNPPILPIIALAIPLPSSISGLVKLHSYVGHSR
jgi:hypothetical protein